MTKKRRKRKIAFILLQQMPTQQALHVHTYIYELNPPCDTRRREKVGALYSTVSGLLAVISRAHSISLSCATEYIALAVV